MSEWHDEPNEEYGPESNPEPFYFDRLSDDLGLTTVAYEDLFDEDDLTAAEAEEDSLFIDGDRDGMDWHKNDLTDESEGTGYADGLVDERDLMDDEERFHRFTW